MKNLLKGSIQSVEYHLELAIKLSIIESILVTKVNSQLQLNTDNPECQSEGIVWAKFTYLDLANYIKWASIGSIIKAIKQLELLDIITIKKVGNMSGIFYYTLNYKELEKYITN